MEQWKSFRVFMKIVIALPMVLVEPGRRNAWTFNPNCKTFFLKIPCHEQFSTSTWPRFRGSADRKSLHARDLELGNWGDSLGSRGMCGALRSRFLEAVGLVVSCYGTPWDHIWDFQFWVQKSLEVVGATLGTRNISTSPGTSIFFWGGEVWGRPCEVNSSYYWYYWYCCYH